MEHSAAEIDALLRETRCILNRSGHQSIAPDGTRERTDLYRASTGETVDELIEETRRLQEGEGGGWYEIREGSGHTDVDAIRRRADALIAETRAIQEHPRKTGGRPSPSSKYNLPPDVVANLMGPALGRAHGHDPYRLAKFLGLPVYRVPHGELQVNKTRPNRDIWGVFVRGPGSPYIQLSDRARGQNELFILAHECGHHLLAANADEPSCNDFARRFLKINDPEWPSPAAATWRRWQEQLYDRERRRRARVAAGAQR